jgi:HK97 family phage major capsid protein
MPVTKRSDFVDPQILAEAVQGAFPGMRVLSGSPAVIVQNTMPSTINGSPVKRGDTVTIPYYNILGQTLDQVTEADALTPAKLSMVSETALVKHYGKAVELTQWSQLVANYADPYGECARQFVQMTQNTIEDEFIVTAAASLDSNFVNDKFSSSTPHLVTYDDFVDSKMKWGDEQGDIVLASVHSKVYGDMLKIKDAVGRPLLVDPNDGSLPRFNGIPIKVSDRNTVTTVNSVQKYQTLIFKKGALIFWFQKEPTIRTQGDALADSDISAIHMYGVPYRYKRTAGYTKPGVVALLTN